MQTFKMTLIAVLVGVASTAAFAQDESDQSRRDRMDAAYGDYQRTQPHTMADPKVEGAIKRDLHRAGRSIKRGANKVGHAIGTGMHKAGAAIDHGGEKVQADTAPK